MRRTVTSLDALDGETREAAELAARRSGLTLENWIETALAEHTARPGAAARPKTERPDAEARAGQEPWPRHPVVSASAEPADGERQARHHAARTAVALDSVATWIEQAEERLSLAAQQAAGQQERMASILSSALGDIKDRLDNADRRAQATATPEPAVFPAAPLVDALSALQHDVAELGQRLDTPKEDVWSPVVNRIRGDIDRLHDTIANLATRDEVATIETVVQGLAETLAKPRPAQEMAVLVGSVASLQRQVHQLSEEVVDGVPRRIAAEIEGLKRQLNVVAAGGVDGSVIAALEAELAGIRQTLGGMAEPKRIERLCEDVAVLARHMADIRLNQIGQSDFAGLKGTLDDIRAHLQDAREKRDSEAVPRQLAGLGERLDILIERSEADGASLPETLARMTERLGPVPDRLAALAEQLAPVPHHLAALSASLATVAAQPDLGSLVAMPEQLERIAARLSALEARPYGVSLEPVGEQLAAVSERLAALAPASPTADLASLTGELSRLNERLNALASHGEPSPRLAELLEQVSGQIAVMAGHGLPGQALLDRLDRLEDSVRQVGHEASTAPLELMLRSVTEKLEQGRPAAMSLDGLEAQIAALTVQLERASAAPPVQPVLSEALAQVRELREDANAIAERAARAVLKDARGPQAGAGAETDILRQGLAELKVLQAQADRKTQHTLKAVHNALETLVLRFPPHGPITARFPEPAPSTDKGAPDPFPAMRLEAAVRKLHKAAIAHTEEITASPTGSDEPADAPAEEPDEILLEPGTPRPPAPAASFTASVDDEPSHVRANFIAAARRAAQSTAPDGAGMRPDFEDETGFDPDDMAPPVSHHTLMERIRQTFDTHRRPLLLGLALLVLTAGTVEMISTVRAPVDEPLAPAAAIEAAPAAAAAAAAAPAAPPEPARATEAAPPAPATTGSLFQPTATEAQPLASDAFTAVPKRVPEPTSAADIPAALPASLREAAIGGNAAALYEVATRTMDGRGVQRDPALAARLFERIAQAGFVPAQARVGNLYEKGLGVTKDLATARTWYERAGISGNARAMHNLAVLFAEGIDGKPDFASAQRWFQDAAETGLRDSQFNLGVLLARGLGTQQDLGQSFKWFSLAAAQGDDEAAKKRDEIAARMSPGDLSAAKALVERWRARPLDPAANEVPIPAQGWSAIKGKNGRG